MEVTLVKSKLDFGEVEEWGGGGGLLNQIANSTIISFHSFLINGTAVK